MTLRPCLDCGEPTALTRRPEHRGYDAEWDRLSRRARRLQPWCSDCGSTEDLQADHLPSAWDAEHNESRCDSKTLKSYAESATAPAAPHAPRALGAGP